MRRLISFFELLGAYAGVRLCPPSRPRNTDLIWPEIPTVADNQRRDYIPKKNYATSRPAAWMLLELAVHNLTNNITLMSKHCKGDSGLCAFSDKTSRKTPPRHRRRAVRETGNPSSPPRIQFPVREYRGEIGHGNQGGLNSRREKSPWQSSAF